MRALLLLASSIACLVSGISIQGAEPPQPLTPPPSFGPAPGQPQLLSPLDAPRPPIPVQQPDQVPAPVPMPLPQPDLSGGFQQPGFNQPTEAQMMERMRQAEAAEEKAGPKFAAPGDDELRKLQIAKYNAAFAEVRSVDAAYKNGTVTFDLIYEAQKRLLQAELELSDKPADQIAAHERRVELTKQAEARVISLYHSASKGGESDKYYQAKFQRLDAEIQLLRAKRKAGLAK